MNVLSLFDGMSCGQIALNELGIEVTNYYASEIDKYAIQVAKKNYPNTKHIGSVIDLTREQLLALGEIDLLIGGSPCQGFSFAGKQKGSSTKCGVDITSLSQYLELKELGFEFDGQSYLFWEYVRVWKIVKPKNFLLENVRITKKWQRMFDEAMGVEPVVINSALMSAQNRVRYYWTNIEGVEQPKDNKLVVRDILEDAVDDNFYLSQKAIDYMGRLRNDKTRWEFHKNPLDGKAACVVAVQYKGVPYGVLRLDKCEQVAYLEMKGNDQIRRVYSAQGKSSTLNTMQGGHRHPKVFDHSKEVARRLTPLECERLQTVPDNYTDCVSNSQRYKMLGNGWTVDVIAHIFRGLSI